MLVYSESILQHDLTDLFDLIRLRQGTFRLEVENLLNTVLGEDVMITSCSFGKTEMQQEGNKIGKSDVGIRPPAEDTFKKLRISSHNIPLYDGTEPFRDRGYHIN